MKRALISVFLGIIGFVLTYISLCYLVPGWRIKLEAEPIVYFMESIKSMAFIKTLISAFIGILLASIPFWKAH